MVKFKVDIPSIAKEVTNDYYRKRYPWQPVMDFDHLRIQIEEFSWQNAHYRIDVFQHEYPSFIPYHQNFWMSHRLFLTKNGKPVLNDPVYTAFAVHPERREQAEENIQGLYPGNYYFKKEFDFIDSVLKDTSIKISGNIGFFPENPELVLDLQKGIEDLSSCKAVIVQLKDGYAIDIEADQYPKESEALFGLSMHHFRFTIYNDGKVSEVTSELIIPPGLC